MAFNELALRPDDRLTRSDYQPKMRETPKFNYDMAFDLKVLQNALKSTSFLQDSGYRSQSETSQKPSMTASCQLYGTGWMMAEDISDEDSEDETWDGFMEVANQRIKVRDLSQILVSRFAFISGLRTNEGHPILTFPDSRSQLTFEEYQILLAYLFQVPPLDEDGDKKNKKGYVLIIDRRTDKWSAVRVLFSYLMNYFPQPVHVIFLLKPEGVLQRALEVGYRNFTENGQFNVVPCQNTTELRDFLGPDCLTMDVGGMLKYNHLEWVQHRMDIERMKSSAAVIAESLSEFGRCLRETELPNDVESTQRILEAQTSERDAIKEDFRISIRKGLQLLRQVRQLEQKPEAEQLSPTRLHNVTAIERMLIQLEDTEKSFDAFWSKHQQKLETCLKLRRFEEGFRKLQSSFAKHMIYLEEHRDVGDGVERARKLADDHDEYAETAMSDVQSARDLHSRGEALMSEGPEGQLSDSLAPKCDELSRMADALTSALDRRAQVLRLSVNMHRQISEATSWCRKGVEILSNIPLDLNNTAASSSAKNLDDFLAEGSNLQLDAFNQMPPNMTNLILLTTTETSSLLAHVAERIEDIKKLGFARRDALQKIVERDSNSKKPVQVVSPEKASKVRHPQQPNSPNKRQIEVLHEFSDFPPSTSSEVSTPVASNSPTRGMAAMELASPQYHAHCLASTSKAAYVIDELLTTEKTYVRELESIVEYYVNPFENIENEKHLPEGLRGQSSIMFGNFRDLYEFHNRHVLPEFQKAQYSPVLLCHIMINFRNHFLKLYRPYCQNKPQSEALRRDQAADGCRFFMECQKKAGHQLPLSAYLLKPIQRITKYQLLLKELLRYCQDEANEEIKHDVQAALGSMLDLLAQINADMQQLHILGYAGDLRLLGPLRLQTECEVYTFKRKTRRLSNKCQKRHLFLFDGGILFCKKRTQPVPYSPEFYEHKMCIYAQSLGFAECSKQSADRFEIWDEQKSDGFAIFAADEVARAKWIQRLAKMTVLHAQQKEGLQKQNSNSRPHSWTSESTVSSRSSNSAFDETQTDSINDNNGNPSSPTSDHHSATSGSVSSRRSSSHTASLGSDAENNTQLPVSKSLQNTALLGHAVSEV